MIFVSLFIIACCMLFVVDARPVVRSIRSAHEFDRLLQKHSTETGLPVVVDFYSDGCGPCRMMAPIFKKVAKEMMDKAVFVKIDTNAQHELSSRYRVQSLPTFQWFLGGRKIQEEKGGIGEGPLRQYTEKAVRQAESENLKLELEDLKAFYEKVEPGVKTSAEIESLYSKCTDLKNKKTEFCQGLAATNLIRKLNKKYKQKPVTKKLFEPEAQNSSSNDEKKSQQPSSSSTKSKAPSNIPNLHLATKKELLEELEKREDEERDKEIEEEDCDEEDCLEDSSSRWIPSGFPEKVVIIGEGPAGLSSAIYAARAGLNPLIIAPSMGGQLQGKGVDVENYPGLHNLTGPAVIASMRSQAMKFGAFIEDDLVTKIDATSRPFKVYANSTGFIETHSIIVASGADSKWLGIPGEYELRGGGVSSCATCDGFLFSGRHVLVVGGGDTAMEDALVLARTSKKVTLVHRRDNFRASKILAERVKDHPLIDIKYNTVIEKIEGTSPPSLDEKVDESDEIDLDDASTTDVGDKIVSGALLKNVQTGEHEKIKCDAVFVAIGHSPNTAFLEGVLEFDSEHHGYIKTFAQSSKTSVPGIYAAGDVSDAVYRQAITSAGSGAAAALDAERYLSEEGLGNEEEMMEAELLKELAAEMNDLSHTDTAYNVYDDVGGRMEGIRESVGPEL